MKSITAFAITLALATSASAITIDMVNVGNAGNSADTRYNSDGFGSVGYTYQIGRYEITAGQYTEFLNAAAKNDLNGLYNLAMGNPSGVPGSDIRLPNNGGYGANIQRNGIPGDYNCSVAADWANRPVNYVSFWDAARFANWLHNGQPAGPQDQTTTEDGAYDLQDFSGLNGSSIVRKPGARFYIPNEDEWYKAAYHKNDGPTGNYWDYPTAADTKPNNYLSNPLPDSGNNANFYSNGFAIGSPYYRTEVGEFENSESPYGTFDQGGNVWEWNETVFGVRSVDLRGLRGGSHDVGDLRASNRDFNDSTSEYFHIGFRIASVAVPEPSTLLLLGFGSLAALWRRRGFVCTSIMAAIVCAATSARAVTIDMVTVGNAGNVADTRFDLAGVGSVSYVYQIGKYEITAGQYTEFLNAVAKADPNELYNPTMGIPFNSGGALGANIQRMGSSPEYSYSVAADWADRPVNYVNFWDAARFANWLHNGQPTGPQGPGTTESGAYHDIGNQALFGRNVGARFYIPTEDEWYKAAYHNKAVGLAADYFDFLTGTNAVPGNDITEATNPSNNANYGDNNPALGSPYYRTVVGEFELSHSPYGTFDQGGNVYEWNESVFINSARGIRGGVITGMADSMRASYRGYGAPLEEDYSTGFRVAASIPEPNSILLTTIGYFAALCACRRSAPLNSR